MSTGTQHRPFSDWGRRHFRNDKVEGKAEGEAEALLTFLSAPTLSSSTRGSVGPSRVERAEDLFD